MTEPETYSFPRYLAAKRTVDERALDRRVQNRLQAELAEMAAPLHVLEVGSGIGATIERVLTWGSLPEEVRYTAVDADADLVGRARTRLLDPSNRLPFEVHEADDGLVAERDHGRIVVELVGQDAFDYVEDTDRTYDLLIAQAFMDLTEVQPALSAFGTVLAAGGLGYFPITFDGATIFEPPIEPDLDDRIQRRFHDHIDDSSETEDGAGDARAGRHLLTALPDVGGEVVAVGSSDWIVRPSADGYPHDEAYFLHHIVDLIRGALEDDPALDSERVRDWVGTRHRQIDRGQLTYIAHQLDVLGRFP